MLNKDKLYHLAAGFAITATISIVTSSPTMGIVIGVLVAAAKEIYDSTKQTHHTVDGLDFISTITGVLLAISILFSGCSMQPLTDEEYVRQHRILNADNLSDAQIIEKRRAYEAETLKWKHTNKLLDDEMKRQNKKELFAQKSLMQIQFFDAYYEHKVSAKDFVDYTYVGQR